MDRRTAVSTLAGILLTGPNCGRGGPVQPSAPARPIGIQLYTMRSLMPGNFDGTLQELAEIGYREVEFAGYFNRTPAAVRHAVTRAGLTAPSAHLDFARLEDRWERAVADAVEAGHRWAVIAWIPPEWRRTTDDWRRLAGRLNAAGAVAKQAGIQLAYHNHDFEFAPIGGVVPFGILVEETDPALVGFEMDLYWCARAGQHPEEWFGRSPGRYRMVHVKDMDSTSEKGMVDPGKGILDFPALLKAAGDAGVEHWFVEHDSPVSPMGTARAGYEYLKKIAANG
jgi:sugar phosphate isomerase/epimerase